MLLGQATSFTLRLENEHCIAGISAEHGGRLLFFRLRDGNNLLFNSAENHMAREDIETGAQDIGPHDGHVMWLSPQNDWYEQQNYWPDRKGDRWPPDPFHEQKSCHVQYKGFDSIQLVGQPSPISGLQYHFTYQLQDRQLTQTTKITNISDREVKWAQWSNTRVKPGVDVFIPQINTLRSEQWKFEFGNLLPNFPCESYGRTLHYKGHFDSFPKRYPSSEGKMFIGADMGKIYCFTPQGEVLIKSFPITEQRLLPPDHGNIEIYPLLKRDQPQNSFIEIENHGAYQCLQPNDSCEMRQSFTLDRIQAGSTTEEQLAYTASKT